MIEFKLRAWYKEEKILGEVEFLDFKFQTLALRSRDFYRYNIALGKVSLMQYTGLKDYKECEIYEGDIVEFTYNGLFLKGEVVFSNGGWELKGVDYGEHFRLIEIVHLCEVIGNIYENKDLLK